MTADHTNNRGIHRLTLLGARQRESVSGQNYLAAHGSGCSHQARAEGKQQAEARQNADSISSEIPAREDQRPRKIEAAARAAIETSARRTLTDAEWAIDRARILEFVSILRAWDRESVPRRRDNVEVLCQREP